MARRIDDKTLHFLHHFARERIKKRNGIHFIVKKFNPYGSLCMFSRENVNGVAPHAESTAIELHIAALILNLHELVDQLAL